MEKKQNYGTVQPDMWLDGKQGQYIILNLKSYKNGFPFLWKPHGFGYTYYAFEAGTFPFAFIVEKLGEGMIDMISETIALPLTIQTMEAIEFRDGFNIDKLLEFLQLEKKRTQ